MSVLALGRKADPEIVRNLKLLLDRAEKGDICGLVSFAEVTGSQFMTTTCGTFNRKKMIGLFEITKTRLVCEILNEAEEQE